MAQKIYTNPESVITFTASGGSTVLSADNVSTGAGRVSAQHDRGAGARAMKYRVEVEVTPTSNVTPGTAGVQMEVYICTAHGDSAKPDSTVGTSDASLSSKNQLLNAIPLGAVVPTGTAGNTGPFVKTFFVKLWAQYVQVALWNALGVSTSNTANATKVRLIPMPDEVQS